MEKLETAHHFQKKIVNFLFNEKSYNKIKLLKIIFDYRIGKTYEMSPILNFFVDKDSVVFDIGANMGQYACRLNNIVGKGKGEIHSFEPVSFNFDALISMKKKLKLKKVTLNKEGISNEKGKAEIKIPYFDDGLVIGTRATISELDEIKYKTEIISLTTIDDYCDNNNIERIDFIKCDTEGNEDNVLKGGKRSITKYLPALSFEMPYNDPSIQWLLDLNYIFFYYDSDKKLLIRITNGQIGNLIMIHKDNLDKFKSIIS